MREIKSELADLLAKAGTALFSAEVPNPLTRRPSHCKVKHTNCTPPG